MSMAQRAEVKSVEAIESFRSALVLYVSRARPVLDEAGGDVLRTRTWLEMDQRVHWEEQLKRRLRVLEQAQQSLFSARISNLRDESAAEVLAVHRAKRQVEEAEEKLRVIKRWGREFENRVQPLLKQIEKMHTLLANDLPKATAHLAQLVKTLDFYAETPTPQPANAAAGELMEKPPEESRER